MSLKIGVTTRSFAGMSTREAAERMRAGGFVCTELCFTQTDIGGWVYNGRGSEAVTAADVAAAAETYREYGVEPVSLGIFGDLRDPDEGERRSDLAHFRRHIDLASAAGIRVVSSECGFTQGRRGVNADTYRDDYDRLKASLAEIARYAEERGVTVALEACQLDTIASPKRLSDLISQLGRECGVRNVRALLDPANFIANADEDDMFRHLAGKIAYFHGKDRGVNDAYGCNLGDGDINWRRFFANLREREPDTPFILEYCGADNAAATARLAEKYYDTSADDAAVL